MEPETIVFLIGLCFSIIVITSMSFWFRSKLKQISQERDGVLDELDIAIERAEERKTKAFQMGINNALGSIHEFLGKLALITKYKDWWFLSGPSKQASIDMVGILDGFLHIIEIKKNGARLTSSENEIRQIIEAGKVRYVVYDADLDFDDKVKIRKSV